MSARDETARSRAYAFHKVGRTRMVVLMSNDRTAVTIVRPYEESGDATRGDGTPIVGEFWATVWVPEQFVTRDADGLVEGIAVNDLGAWLRGDLDGPQEEWDDMVIETRTEALLRAAGRTRR